MNTRNIVIVSVTAVAAVAAVVALTTTTPPGTSAPAGPVAGARPLVGAGSATTADVLDALARDVPGIASTRAGALPGCSADRPSSDALGVQALVAQQAGGAACLDFARSSADTSASPDLVGSGLTWIPFAIDAVSFVQRADSVNPRSLTSGQLREIFTCTSPAQAGYRPFLPAVGSGLRANFLAFVGLVDAADFIVSNPCVTEGEPGGPENSGRDLIDARQIAPHSVAQYLAQTGGVIQDRHSTAVLGLVDGIAPTLPNPASPVGVVQREDSGNTRTLTVEQLAAIYTCSASPAAQQQYLPLLPGPGSAVRATFLQSLGLADASDFRASHPCVSEAGGDGGPLAENVGTVLTDSRHIAPYAVDRYLAQANGVEPDMRGVTILTRTNGVAPTLLNIDFPFAHEVFTVLPTGELDDDAVAAAFVGPLSAVCARADTIARHGFGVAMNCGDTTTRSG